MTSLRVHPRKDVLDDAVLARGVRSLEKKKNRPFVVRVEPSLQIRDSLDALGQERLGPLLSEVESAGVRRIPVFQLERRGEIDPVSTGEIGQLLLHWRIVAILSSFS